MVFSTSEGTLPPSLYPEHSFLSYGTPELWVIISRLLLATEIEYHIKKPLIYIFKTGGSTTLGFSFFLLSSQILETYLTAPKKHVIQ